jgi:two component system response regulator
MSIQIGLVDDQTLFRTGIALVLDSQPDLCVAWQAADGQEAIDRYAATPVDLVLMDVQMPRLDGISATRTIIADHTAARIVMLTTFDTEEYVIDALAAGASGFLLKDTEPEQLLDSVRTAVAGEAVISPRATRRILTRLRQPEPDSTRAPLSAADRRALACLTAREQEILIAIGQGWSNTEIGQRLFISMPTVKTHVGRVLAKIEARDRVHAALFAYRTGLVDRDDLLAP